MGKLNQETKKFLNETKTWILTTTDNDTPNAVPIFFKKIDEEDNLVLFQVFMNKTIQNIQKNACVAVTVYNDETLQGYQLKGSATYTTDASLVAEGNAISNTFKLTTKGAVIIHANETIILTPGADNGKIL